VAFGRKKSKDDEPEAVVEDVESKPLPPEPVAVTTGPYDEADVADDDETPRLDLGGIRVAIGPDCEVRVDLSPEGTVLSAVAVHRAGQLQVNAFAAPRRDGIWDDVRREIAESLRNEQGGAAEEADGPFGRELRARIPGQQPGQLMPARFIGVDGPRWFLRGLITGPAATDPAQAGVLEEVFRQTVVVRGNDAMAPRDGIPLRLPKEAQEAAAAAAAQAQADAEAAGETPPGRFAGGDDFNPFERGPEITETR
jgi:hypothetical protein